MILKKFKVTLMAAALSAICATTAQAENIKLRIASGHPNANTYVNLMQNFFVPEVTKRVAENPTQSGVCGRLWRLHGESRRHLGRCPIRHHRHRRILLLL